MGFQPAGVKEFIKLDDTPAAYTGASGKAAAVKATEDGLEFVPMAGQPVYPVFDDTVIYPSAAKNDTWQDLDCGVGQAIVYLKIQVSAAENAVAKFRQNGETIDLMAEDIGNAKFTLAGGEVIAYAMMATDSSGLIEWRYSGSNQVTVTRIGYWKGADVTKSLLLDGFSVDAWTDLDCQVSRAIVILLIVSDHANGHNWYGRLKGATEETDYGVLYSSLGTINWAGYVLGLTDADGKLQWKCNTAGRDIRIYRVGYILGADFRNGEQFFTGNPPAAWTDLDPSLPRGFLYLRHNNATGVAGFDDVKFRRNGDVSEIVGDTGLVGSNVGQDKICYNFVMLDPAGLCEWKGNNAKTANLYTEAISK